MLASPTGGAPRVPREREQLGYAIDSPPIHRGNGVEDADPPCFGSEASELSARPALKPLHAYNHLRFL